MVRGSDLGRKRVEGGIGEMRGSCLVVGGRLWIVFVGYGGYSHVDKRVSMQKKSTRPDAPHYYFNKRNPFKMTNIVLPSCPMTP
jgi:hypothetical protein